MDSEYYKLKIKSKDAYIAIQKREILAYKVLVGLLIGAGIIYHLIK